MKITHLAPILLLICIAAGIGSSVDQARVTTFTAGSPALASEVNENYQALIEAINDNADRLQRLEQGVPLATLEELVSGSTYKLMVTPTVVGGGDNDATPGNLWVAHGVVTEEVTLNPDQSVSSTGSNQWFFPYKDLETPESDLGMTSESDSYDDNGTWSIDGSSIVFNFGGDAVSFQMSQDGSMGITTVVESYTPDPGSVGELQGPRDGHFVSLAALVLTVIAPEIDEVLTSGLTAQVILSNSGSGGVLTFARSLVADGRHPPSGGWQVEDSFPLVTGSYYYWARRSSVPSEPVEATTFLP